MTILSKKLRRKSYLINKYGYCFRYFIRFMTLKTPKGTARTLAGVILGFSTLIGTNSQIYPPKRYDDHPVIFLGESPRVFGYPAISGI